MISTSVESGECRAPAKGASAPNDRLTVIAASVAPCAMDQLAMTCLTTALNGLSRRIDQSDRIAYND